jgi:hypothetical protein
VVGEWRRSGNERVGCEQYPETGSGAQQGDDGDDDSNNPTMTTTMRTWARGRAEWWEELDGWMDGMFCVVRLCDELRMQSQRQGRHKQRRFA